MEIAFLLLPSSSQTRSSKLKKIPLSAAPLQRGSKEAAESGKKHFRLKKFESIKRVEKNIQEQKKKNNQSRLRRKSPLVALKVESASGTLRQTRTPRVATMAKNSPAVGSSANSTKSPALSPFALPLPPKNCHAQKRKNGKAPRDFSESFIASRMRKRGALPGSCPQARPLPPAGVPCSALNKTHATKGSAKTPPSKNSFRCQARRLFRPAAMPSGNRTCTGA